MSGSCRAAAPHRLVPGSICASRTDLRPTHICDQSAGEGVEVVRPTNRIDPIGAWLVGIGRPAHGFDQ